LHRRSITLLVLVVAATAGLASRQNPRTLGTLGPESFASRVVAADLANPWEVTWGPDGHLWITERTAFRVTRVNPANGSRRVALTLDDVYQSVVQDGLMGLALHPDLLQSRGRDYVYLAYTYDADPREGVTRRLRVRRYTYDAAAQTLGSPFDVLDNLPAHDDHGGGRLAIGRDGKLYLSRGDQGGNWLSNYCTAIRAQDLPTAREVAARDWSTYQGKILRMDLDGAIPPDNPTIGGVRSHIYSYGLRNPQGLSFGVTGLLYASEHGPSTDDEVDLIQAGKNYGWPHVAGYNDDRSYVYANWSASAPAPCASLKFDSLNLPASVPAVKESAWQHPDFVPPLTTLFTVPAGYDLATHGNATIAPGSIEVYAATAIPGWRSSLLVTGMRTGTVYRVKLSDDGTSVAGPPLEYFRRANRYRDTAVAADGRRIFVVTDSFGATSDEQGRRTEALAQPGALLEFSYAPADRKERQAR
jgi:PQQ-dependent dehydrogenase (s-GDH family)